MLRSLLEYVIMLDGITIVWGGSILGISKTQSKNAICISSELKKCLAFKNQIKKDSPKFLDESGLVRINQSESIHDRFFEHPPKFSRMFHHDIDAFLLPKKSRIHTSNNL